MYFLSFYSSINSSKIELFFNHPLFSQRNYKHQNMKESQRGMMIKSRQNVDDVRVHPKLIYFQQLSDMSQEVSPSLGRQSVDNQNLKQTKDKRQDRAEKIHSDNGIHSAAQKKSSLHDSFHEKSEVSNRSRMSKSKHQNPQGKSKGLKNIVRDLKVKSLVSNFRKKLKLNSLQRQPVQFNPFNKSEETYHYTGIQFNSVLLSIFYFLSIAYTFTICFFASISVVFHEMKNSEEILIIQAIGLCWTLLEIVINMIRVKHDTTERIQNLWQITQFYLKSYFWMDISCLLSLILDISFEGEWTIYLRLIFLLRIAGIHRKIQYLEAKIFNTSYKEHYWGLGKIFLSNFIFAHLLAVFLIAMTYIDAKNNWLSKVNAIGAPWYEQYSWAYYWGTTIMLTVGFGDLSAANYKEALCLTMIQTLGCITLAYNINLVGTLISNIQAEQKQKQKKQKILKNLAEKNDITHDLSSKISNYIEESSNIRKKFNLQQENYFFTSLPDSLKKDFLRESNKKMFNSIMFFKALAEQTLVKLAENIEMSITHPDELIERIEDHPQVLILKQGKVSFISKLNGSCFNGTSIDEINVKQGQIPTLLSYEFIVPIFNRNYQINSESYSILYKMKIQDLKSILQQKEKDIEYYFFLKDKSKHVLNEFETINCEYCKEKHLKFRCPRLHFVPVAQFVIFREIHHGKKRKNKRRFVVRDKQKNNPFISMLYFEKDDNNQQKIKLSIIKKNTVYNVSNQGENSDSLDKSLKEKKQKEKEKVLIKQIVENMKDHVFGYLNQGNSDLWLIEADVMKDYQFYFPESNSKNLSEKYVGKNKRKRCSSFVKPS